MNENQQPDSNSKPKRRVPLVPAILAGSALFVVGGLAGGAVGASAVMVAGDSSTSQGPGEQNGPGRMGGGQNGGQSDGGGMPGGQTNGGQSNGAQADGAQADGGQTNGDGTSGGQSNGMPDTQDGSNGDE